MTATELLAAEIKYITTETGQKKVQIDLTTWQKVIALLEIVAQLEDLEDEAEWDRKWNESFARSADKLAMLAEQVREEKRQGKTEPLNLDELLDER